MDEGYLAGEQRVAQLTRGNLHRSILSLSLPVIVGHTFIIALELIDAFFLGRLGSAPLAAVTMAGAIIFFLSTFGAGLGIGTVALVARAFGERKYAQAHHIGAQAFILGFGMSLALGIAGFLISPSLLRLLGAEGQILAIGDVYLKILFTGLFMMFFMFLGGAVFQGAGDTLTPMKIGAISTTLNIILDPIMIFGLFGFPRMEAAGAAFATLIARLAGSLLMLRILLRGRHTARIETRSLRPDFPVMKRIFTVGFPGALQLLLRSTSGLVLTRIAASFGPVVLAAYGVGGRLFGMFLLPGFGFATAAATLVGQNLGAKNPDRAAKGAELSALYYLIFLVVCAAPIFLFADSVAAAFNPEPEFVRIASEFIRFIAAGSLFLSAGVVFGRALQGAGDTVSPMVMTGISLYAVQIPAAYLLALNLGLAERGIWIANFMGSLVNAALMSVVFFRGNWKSKGL